MLVLVFFFFKQKTAYEMRISDWSSDVCSSDLRYAEPFYRLLYGESDGVPGLTVERMGDVVVAQATTAGIERLRGPISEAIEKVLAPRAQIGRASCRERVCQYV